jgi:hypothetical protein
MQLTLFELWSRFSEMQDADMHGVRQQEHLLVTKESELTRESIRSHIFMASD